MQDFALHIREIKVSEHNEYMKKYVKTEKGRAARKRYLRSEAGQAMIKRGNKKRRDNFLELKRQYSCEICGERDPACIDFHHINPKAKELDISYGATTWGLERLRKEIDKCRALCANCHRKLHFYKEE